MSSHSKSVRLTMNECTIKHAFTNAPPKMGMQKNPALQMQYFSQMLAFSGEFLAITRELACTAKSLSPAEEPATIVGQLRETDN
jgi:hypothetical protein